jgi:hypothetical protein
VFPTVSETQRPGVTVPAQTRRVACARVQRSRAAQQRSCDRGALSSMWPPWSSDLNAGSTVEGQGPQTPAGPLSGRPRRATRAGCSASGLIPPHSDLCQRACQWHVATQPRALAGRRMRIPGQAAFSRPAGPGAPLTGPPWVICSASKAADAHWHHASDAGDSDPRLFGRTRSSPDSDPPST